jgi:hypothetical protein
MRTILITSLLLLTACSGSNYRTPGLSGTPSKMSSDTLCFRYASSKSPDLAAEIDARNIDCAALLRDDPLYTGPDEAAYRMH